LIFARLPLAQCGDLA